MNDAMKQLHDKLDAAARFEHPERLMRVTMECAHMRLMTFRNSIGGIGFNTTCNICSVARVIVNVEETGVL
jgi:hypothetical protein